GARLPHIDPEAAGQLGSLVADQLTVDEEQRLDVGLEAVTLHAGGELDALRGAERILRDAGDVVDRLDLADLLQHIREYRLAVEIDRLRSFRRKDADVQDVH